MTRVEVKPIAACSQKLTSYR